MSSHDIVEISLPLPHASRKGQREAFIRIGIGIMENPYMNLIHDSNYSVDEPTETDIKEKITSLLQGEVIIVLASNEWTMENELHAFIVYTIAGWKKLRGEMKMFPEVVKPVNEKCLAMYEI